jgi:transcriptional regulator with XRE-family HTH domain
MTQTDWPREAVRVVAEEVKRIRKNRGMSAQQLADKTVALGQPMARSVIANLESGRRETITLPELVVLARSLGVPPLLLMFPVGRREEIDTLPGGPASTLAALDWFIGQGRFPSPYRGEGDVDSDTGLHEWYVDPELGWEEGATDLRLFLEHRQAVVDWDEAPSVIRRTIPRDDEAAAMEALNQRRARAEDVIRRVRADMRHRGLTPPALPVYMRYIDEEAQA